MPAKNRTPDFSGQVGKYKLETWIDKDKILVNDALNLSVKITGDGNMSMLDAPRIQFPKSFEVFEPRVDDNTRKTATGISGSKTFNFIILPSKSGIFNIPKVTFTYFDPSVRDYVSLSSDEYRIQVFGKEDSESIFLHPPVAETEQDIRFIKLNAGSFKSLNVFFFGSSLFFILITIPLLCFVLFIVLLRRKIQLRNNPALAKYLKAKKTARKRLKKASFLLRNKQINEFYEETAHAIWSYLGDRFSIQQSELSISRVILQLEEKKVNGDILGSLKSTLEFCEYIRFAPGASATTSEDILQKAEETIRQLEEHISENKIKNKETIKNKVSLILILLMFFSFSLSADNYEKAKQYFEAGVEQYKNGKFYEAIENFESILKLNTVNFEVYYNLGNAYFKIGKIPESIYYYEKALQLNPHNEDAWHNLSLVNSFLQKEIQVIPEAFHIRFADIVMKLFSPNRWAIISIIIFSITIVCLSFFLLQTNLKLKKFLFYLTFVGLFFTATCVYFGYRSYKSIISPRYAIIMVPSLGIKSSPDISSADVYMAYAGTKVKILSHLGHWYEVRVPDGNKGWVKKDVVRLI